MIHLVIGGARSGKSAYAESLAAKYHQTKGYECHYVATASALDDEMASRISRHQQDRKESALNWITHESPLELAETLKKIAAPNRIILVDCLTLWLTNELLREGLLNDNSFPDRTITQLNQQKSTLINTLNQLCGIIILVSNEVGFGIVPIGKMNRQFIDEAGWLNQSIASASDKVTLTVAGLPLHLK